MRVDGSRGCEWMAVTLRKWAHGIFKAHRLLYHSTLGLRVIKKKKK